MDDIALALRRKKKKQQLIRLTIVVCLILVVALTWLETRVFEIGQVSLPLSGNVVVFALININVLLLLLVVFLVLRNLAELFFDRRRRLAGARLRTKLVLSFISLSLIPTGLLFFISLQFISTSMEYWFNINVEDSLVQSLDLARGVYQDKRQQASREAQGIGVSLQEGKKAPPTATLAARIDRFVADGRLAGVQLYSGERQLLAERWGESLPQEPLPVLPPEVFRRALAGETGVVDSQSLAGGELLRAVAPVDFALADGGPVRLVVAAVLVGQEDLAGMEAISRGLEGYRQLMLLKKPIKTSLLVMLLIVTLLIVFAAIWFGFYVASTLTGPIGKLAEATRRVADGDLDFVLEKEAGDEMGTLVDSFNQMTLDLRGSRKAIDRANSALSNSNIALEERRRYTEIILQNVTAGVISLDEKGRITTVNRYAEELLKIDRSVMLHRQYREVIRDAHLVILEKFLAELAESGKPSILRHVRLTVGDETFSLRVNFVRLEDEKGAHLGVVLVFDNLTELEKAQRMAAWREVARRIAHEVKNPLTPIQLSAQRLRKRYLEKFQDLADGEVFDSCTRTIINQVDDLKRLVGEFSSFARMPAVAKERNRLADMMREVLVLYREAHPQIDFVFNENGEVPVFTFDRAQLRRVVVNLLDNAVAVLPDGGTIDMLLAYEPATSSAVIEVADNGPGVSEEHRLRLFEPYYSTKKTGTGLGLAIASSIIADHGGTIRVKNREPHGARFIIELPVVGAA